MDLSAYSLQKLNKEKRERQPNWTESEKQLLLSLTRMHQSILENKGSDTMTIKRKSEAWDEIGMRMKAAGFNRSKERLKQQLGRIRAAETKKIKDAIEKNVSTAQNNSLNASTNNLIVEENVISQIPSYINGNINDVLNQGNSTKSILLPMPLSEPHCIKTENNPLFDEHECSDEEIHMNSEANVSSCRILNISKHNISLNDTKIMDNMHFTLQNVQSLAETNRNIDTDDITIEAKAAKALDVTSTMPCSIASSNIKSSSVALHTNHRGNEENANSNNQRQKKWRLRSIRQKRIRAAFTRQQGLRQLYMYRVAVERERLRSLKMQQKRDRILYRKDVEIQNLKLQILRNLTTNQNRDANRINL